LLFQHSTARHRHGSACISFGLDIALRNPTPLRVWTRQSAHSSTPWARTAPVTRRVTCGSLFFGHVPRLLHNRPPLVASRAPDPDRQSTPATAPRHTLARVLKASSFQTRTVCSLSSTTTRKHKHAHTTPRPRSWPWHLLLAARTQRNHSSSTPLLLRHTILPQARHNCPTWQSSRPSPARRGTSCRIWTWTSFWATCAS